ncbi:phosphoenolpyruvate carboxykinase (ATP) [Streptacidiphilus rugosus]|uniref:hypothetical protein n=1 Tax=Streptacidiphilus rugosus TaxID=405783 RepID=UPI00056D5C19|nr:hypothetical protein [Streptacidiphilus rugosus]
MTTSIDSREVEPTASYEIAYRDAQVRAVFDRTDLAERLRRAFTAYGALVSPPVRLTVPTVGVFTAADTGAVPARDQLKVPHGGGRIAVPAGLALLHDGPPRSLVTVARPQVTVAQLDPGDPHLPFLHYLLKYPLRRQVEAQGSILAHSSAVESAPGQACVFLGPSGAGKTTVFVELVSRGLRALGNDATLLTPAGAAVEAATWPHVVRIGAGTAGHNAVMRRLPEDWARRNPADQKIEVFFDELDALFGCPIAAPPSQVTTVVDLGIDTAGEGLTVRRLTGPEIRRFLQERLIGDRLPTGWLPGWSWRPRLESVHEVADRLASTTAMYQVRAGVATPRWADQLADWVRDLTPTAPTGDAPLPRALTVPTPA